MPQNYGKVFEQILKQDFQRIDGVSIIRLQDQFNGWKQSYNICDFIVYKYPSLVYLEAKSTQKNTFDLQTFVQYDRLLQHSNIKGVHPIVVIWFINHDKVIAFPILSLKKMKEDGLKSINIKTYFNYPHIEIPSIKKRIFMQSDYNKLFEYCREQEIDNG